MGAHVRVGFQKLLIAHQPLLEPLGVIQPVHPHDQLAKSRRSHHSVVGALSQGRLARRQEILDVDTDREDPGLDCLAKGLDGVQRQKLAMYARLRRYVVPKKVQPFAGLEAYQVVVEHRLDQPSVVRQRHQQLPRRPRHMKKEADPVGHAQAAQIPGQRDHVIVVYPDDVLGLDQRGQRLGEAGIGPLIAFAVRALISRQVHAVVKQRPQRLVGVAVVIFLDVLRLQIDQGDGDAGAILELGFGIPGGDRLA